MKNYLMALQVPFYRIDQGNIAIESSLMAHLRLLKQNIPAEYNRFTLALPEMSKPEYHQKSGLMINVNEAAEGISFVALYQYEESRQYSGFTYLLVKLFPTLRHIRKIVANCDLLHSGLSTNIWYPTSFIAVVWGILLHKKVIYFVDIDFRKSAWMNYKTGRWSLKSYLLCKYIYDPLRSFQVKVAVAYCDAVFLKGKDFCRDFGRGKPNVKNFLNASHSEKHIIPAQILAAKVTNLLNEKEPLKIVYFGRLTAYKGLEHCIRAVAQASAKTDRPISFQIIGTGEQQGELTALQQALGVESIVTFHQPLPFGPKLFEELYQCHLLLAAPLSEDTPRSALDAMAAGIPILAYDTYYYRDLVDSGAVTTVEWLSIEKMANMIVELNQQRLLLAKMANHAVDFARANTQEKWLELRRAWAFDLDSTEKI